MKRNRSSLVLSSILLLALVVAFLPAGCGADSDEAQYAEECAVTCTPRADTPCAGVFTSTCQRDCGLFTEGRAPLCAQCLIDHWAWKGVQCVCPNADIPTECCLCEFGPSASACTCETGETCAPEEEDCDNYTLILVTDHVCKDTCLNR